MTEQMAIENIKHRYNIAKRMVGKGVNSNDLQDIEVALKALEEIQQYRAIGTVEDIRLIFSLCKDLEKMVKKYESIGTIAELQALKEKSVAKKWDESFVSMDSAIFCPVCLEGWNVNDNCTEKFKYCPNCGQALEA